MRLTEEDKRIHRRLSENGKLRWYRSGEDRSLMERGDIFMALRACERENVELRKEVERLKEQKELWLTQMDVLGVEPWDFD